MKNSALVVAMTGATGQIYGIRALQFLADVDVETHLILSRASKINIENEEDYSVREVRAMADRCYDYEETPEPLIDPNWENLGVLVAPCSMKTLGAIAHATGDNLITRCADLALRNRRTLVLMPREKPFDRIHLKNMLAVHDAGGTIMPPFLSFYTGRKTLDELINRTVQRTLRLFDLPLDIDQWEGIRDSIRSRKESS